MIMTMFIIIIQIVETYSNGGSMSSKIMDRVALRRTTIEHV